MTVLQALTILEAATLEWKKRNINTPEVSDALDLLEPYVWPKWLVLQFRMALCRGGDGECDLEDQQELLRATFPGMFVCTMSMAKAAIHKYLFVRKVTVDDEIDLVQTKLT